MENRNTYPERIVQFGEGNFLRGFVDWQVDRMNKRAGFSSSVAIVQPRANGNVGMLNDQNGLYTLFLQGLKNGSAIREHTVIEAVSRGINPYTEYGEYVKLAENPELRFIVSNTTEAGIAFAPDDKLTDSPPSSFPGKLTAFLYHRYQFFNGSKEKGLVIIPCELIDQNGEELKKIVLQFSSLWNLEKGFTNWLEENNVFCSSLVDRIVPGFPKDSISEITEELGYEDRLVVVGEQYHLWVIEGPAWLKAELPVEEAGLNTLIVDDMTPYRTRKVRILNGAHTAMTPISYLCNKETVGEAMLDGQIGEFVRELITNEIIPILDLPKAELTVYADEIIDRFLNPYITHYVMDISLNSISKFKTRDLPTLLEFVDRKAELPQKLVFSLSALLFFYKGKRGDEQIILRDDDSILSFFHKQWSTVDGSLASMQAFVLNVLQEKLLWDQDLGGVAGLADTITNHLMRMEHSGMRNALQACLENARN
ncbi:tagaturonate reductase [Niallia circulans]|uniref:Tagaturonate reductase n=1 Tax=Niallia circulans TaxID=1397 RepID=A0A553SQ77_NIACI|nr:tagaturonate reductase [Niallia circulans]TRZ39142.1 tagaturonate reductase [Niallia circulans]